MSNDSTQCQACGQSNLCSVVDMKLAEQGDDQNLGCWCQSLQLNQKQRDVLAKAYPLAQCLCQSCVHKVLAENDLALPSLNSSDKGLFKEL